MSFAEFGTSNRMFSPKSLCNSADFRQTCFLEMSFAKIGTSDCGVVPFFKLAQRVPRCHCKNQYENKKLKVFELWCDVH